jgi:hypothetical protein
LDRPDVEASVSYENTEIVVHNLESRCELRSNKLKFYNTCIDGMSHDRGPGKLEPTRAKSKYCTDRDKVWGENQ